MIRILIVRMGSMGDIVHTLPAAATLKHAFPDAEIDWLVEREWIPLLAGNPHIAQLQVVETQAWRKKASEPATWRSLLAVVSALRARRYDYALDFQGLLKSATLARLSGARRILGWHRDELREPWAHFFYTASAESIEPGVMKGTHAATTHVVDRNLALAKMAGAEEPVYEFHCRPSEEDERKFREWCQKCLGGSPALACGSSVGGAYVPNPPFAGGAAKSAAPPAKSGAPNASDTTQHAAPSTQHAVPQYIVLSPGAGWEAKRWPEESFAELARRLAAETHCAVVVNCGPGEEAIAGRVAELAGAAHPITVKPSLGELIGLTSHAALVVAGDTGPLHLAAACGAPVVGIFGPTDPRRNGPIGRACRSVRAANAQTTYARQASRELIASVTVDDVFGAAAGLLGVSR